MTRPRPTIAVSSSDRPAEPPPCVSAEPFALRVTDDSMLPEFMTGMVVVVDPSLAAKDGDFVVAALDGVPTLGRFDRSPGGASVHTQTQSWPIVAGRNDVLGVVVQRAGPRRSWHKHYR